MLIVYWLRMKPYTTCEIYTQCYLIVNCYVYRGSSCLHKKEKKLTHGKKYNYYDYNSIPAALHAIVVSQSPFFALLNNYVMNSVKSRYSWVCLF